MGDNNKGNLGDSLYALVLYLHLQANEDLLDQITAEELSVSELRLLERMRHRRPTIRQAAAIAGVTPQHASRMLAGLARRGLVRREDNEDDARSRRVMITDRGHQVIHRLHQARRAQILEFVDALDDQEQEQLQSALGRLLQRESIAACRPTPIAA